MSDIIPVKLTANKVPLLYINSQKQWRLREQRKQVLIYQSWAGEIEMAAAMMTRRLTLL